MMSSTLFPPPRNSSTAALSSRVTSSSFAEGMTRRPRGSFSGDGGRKREVRPSTKVKVEERAARSRSRPYVSEVSLVSRWGTGA